jgi:hypothetical protein
MPLDERNVPLPPDNGGNEDLFASRSTNRYLPPRYRGDDDSPLPRPARMGRHHGA